MTLDELKRLIAEASKGPWRIGPDEEGDPAQCLSAGCFDIATLWGGYFAAEANARLIAAAPDFAAQVARLTEALDMAFPIVRKAAVAAKLDVVNCGIADPTFMQRAEWMRKTDDALQWVVSARAALGDLK